MDGARRGRSDPNAFVLPGGHVFVHAGLLDLLRDDDDALAFVIGHEMGHQLCRHAMEKATLRCCVLRRRRRRRGRGGDDGRRFSRRRRRRRRARRRRRRRGGGLRAPEQPRDGTRGGLGGRATHGARVLRSARRRAPRAPSAAAARRAAAGRDGDDDAAMETMKALDTALEAYVSTHPDSESDDALAPRMRTSGPRETPRGATSKTRRQKRHARRRAEAAEKLPHARVSVVSVVVGGGVGGVGGVGGGVGGGVVGGVVGGPRNAGFRREPRLPPRARGEWRGCSLRATRGGGDSRRRRARARRSSGRGGGSARAGIGAGR